MGLDLTYSTGQTPIDADEIAYLKISTITTQNELNQFEQLNIEKAIEWSLRRKLIAKQILTEEFIKNLHKKMFGDVWEWAGTFRKSNKNIGVDKYEISVELKKLLDNCMYWIENSTYEYVEIAIRFKHRLVEIHLFPNGNGRHSRLMADIIISHIFKKPVFTWKSSDLIHEGEMRNKYIKALRKADRGDYPDIIGFVIN
jgi:Fic-DOC domain mobile mystery protein B